MKTPLILLFVLFSLSAFAQAKPDSTAVQPADTIKVDLVRYGAIDKLRAIDQERMQIQAQALVLQERSKNLDTQYNSVLDGEYKHHPKYDVKREIVSYSVVGTDLVVLIKQVVVLIPDKKLEKKKPK